MKVLFKLAALCALPMINSVANAQEVIPWGVSIVTADVDWAGTDAYIGVCIAQNNRCLGSGHVIVDPEGDSYERATVTTGAANLPAMDLSEKFDVSLKMYVEEAGDSPGWRPESVILFNPINRMAYIFKCNSWLEIGKTITCHEVNRIQK